MAITTDAEIVQSQPTAVTLTAHGERFQANWAEGAGWQVRHAHSSSFHAYHLASYAEVERLVAEVAAKIAELRRIHATVRQLEGQVTATFAAATPAEQPDYHDQPPF